MMDRCRVLFAAGLVSVLLLPAAASADTLNFGSWSGYGTSNNYNHGYNGYNAWQGGNGWNGNNSWHRYGNGYNNQGHNCRQVQERTRDNWGKPAVIVSTQCYDRHGNAYIVPGSSYIMRWH
jgi:hypothetical protein